MNLQNVDISNLMDWDILSIVFRTAFLTNKTIETMKWNYMNKPTQLIRKTGIIMQVNLREAFKKTIQRLGKEPFMELKVVEPEHDQALSLHTLFEEYIHEIDQLLDIKSKQLTKNDTTFWMNEVKQCHNELRHLPIATYFFHDITNIAYWKTTNSIYRLIYSQANPQSQIIIAMSKTTLQ